MKKLILLLFLFPLVAFAGHHDYPTPTPLVTPTPNCTPTPSSTPAPTVTPTDTPIPSSTPVPTTQPTDTPIVSNGGGGGSPLPTPIIYNAVIPLPYFNSSNPVPTPWFIPSPTPTPFVGLKMPLMMPNLTLPRTGLPKWLIIALDVIGLGAVLYITYPKSDDNS